MQDATIHIVDGNLDDGLARQSLEFLLTAAGYVVCIHNDCKEFMVDTPDDRKIVLIADIPLLEAKDVDFLSALRTRRNEVAVIVISDHGEIPMAVNTMKAGAFDFLQKPFDDRDLLQAIEGASCHLAEVVGEKTHALDVLQLKQLTPREHDVLKGLMGGLSKKLIGRELNISPRTVEIYRSNLMSKLKVKRLADLIRMVLIPPRSAN